MRGSGAGAAGTVAGAGSSEAAGATASAGGVGAALDVAAGDVAAADPGVPPRGCSRPLAAAQAAKASGAAPRVSWTGPASSWASLATWRTSASSPENFAPIQVSVTSIAAPSSSALRGQAEDIRIELLATLEGGRGVRAGSGPDPADLVGGDGGSHSAAADEHAGLDEVAQHRLADFARTVGIVDGLGGERAEVQHHVAARLEGRDERPFSVQAVVVRADRDAHEPGSPLLPSIACALVYSSMTRTSDASISVPWSNGPIPVRRGGPAMTTRFKRRH